MKWLLKLFGRADGGHSAFDVIVADAKKILGSLVMATLAYAGILSLALDRAIRSFHFKRIVTGCACFRPPFFTLEKNGIIFGALGCYADCSGFVIRFFGTGCSLGWEFLKLTGRVGINRLSAATINIYKGEQSQ